MGLLFRRVMQSKVQRVNETVYLGCAENAAKLNYVLAIAGRIWAFSCSLTKLHCPGDQMGNAHMFDGVNDENHATSCHSGK